MVTVVSSDVCPYCHAAKSLLDSLGIEYTEVTVNLWGDDLRAIIEKTGMMTVPQIFNGEIAKENLLGGYTDIAKLHEEGKLLELLG